MYSYIPYFKYEIKLKKKEKLNTTKSMHAYLT